MWYKYRDIAGILNEKIVVDDVYTSPSLNNSRKIHSYQFLYENPFIVIKK